MCLYSRLLKAYWLAKYKPKQGQAIVAAQNNPGVLTSKRADKAGD